jgi:hypothetical protein
MGEGGDDIYGAQRGRRADLPYMEGARLAHDELGGGGGVPPSPETMWTMNPAPQFSDLNHAIIQATRLLDIRQEVLKMIIIALSANVRAYSAALLAFLAAIPLASCEDPVTF